MLWERLKRHTRLTDAQIERLGETASNRYKAYFIPKRDGGERLIEQPSREIKALQRWIILNCIGWFPVHECATAYSTGASIKKNAERHRTSNFTLRVDFKDFFPSFNISHVGRFLEEKRGALAFDISDRDIAFVCKLVSRHNKLTIGAPSSPVLTNAMMYDFDDSISQWCLNRGLIFTRYADDIFISSMSSDRLDDALQELIGTAEEYIYANLAINRKKTAFLSRRYRRSITGLNITPERKLSIGRSRKEHVKSEVYHFKLNRLETCRIQPLCGMLAFVEDVEPSFYQTLIRKYGVETIKEIQRRATQKKTKRSKK